MLVRMTAAAAFVALSTLQASAQGAPTLDYTAFKARVEPIFLKKRAGHVRCYVCHADSNNALKLVPLSPGAKAWDEEQSRRNFATVSMLVTVGDPDASRLLQHPLAPEAGGDVFHSGGRQFASKDDPDYRALAQWINGAKPADRSKK